MNHSGWWYPVATAAFVAHSAVVHADEVATDSTGTVVVSGLREWEQQVSAANGALGSKQLLDTPFSITVVDGQDIYRRQANSVAQVFVNDPSVFSASTSATTAWWGAQIRGLGVRNYYIDDVPMLLYWGGEFPLEPIESVEALKGLSGFMYGFGAPGGVIRYETKKPTNESLLTASAGYRNNGVFLGNVDAGGRVGDYTSGDGGAHGDGDGLGYRVNLAGESGEAYNSAEVNRSVASLALDYKLSDSLTWHASTIYEDSKLEEEPLHFYFDSYPGGALPRPTYHYDDVNVGNSWYKAETFIGSTGLKWQINQVWTADLTLGASRKEHQSNKMFAYLLNEAGDYEGAAYNFGGVLKYTFSQAMVQGRFETGAIRHDLVLGAAFQRSTSQWSNEWYWNNDFNGNLYETQTFVVTRPLDFSLAPVSEDERQKALFASDTLYFGSRWQAIVGARFTDYELIDFDGDPGVDSGYKADALSPTFALIFKPAEHTSLYGSYVESMEQGSRVGETYANFGEILDATTSKQYELGAKYEAARLMFTTAAFRVERAAQIDQVRDGLRYLTQDGMTTYEGVEAIGRFGVTPQLTAGLGATFLDSVIDEVSEENAALKGKRPSGAARWQIVGNVDYRFPAVPGLSVFGNVRYFDDVWYDDNNTVLIPSRTLANAGFQYQTTFTGRQAVIAGSINNLFDHRYWELNTLGEGRNGSLSMRVSW